MRTRLYSMNESPGAPRSEIGYLVDDDIFAGTQQAGGTQAGYMRGKNVYASNLNYAGRAVGYVSDSSVYAGRPSTGNLVGYLLDNTVYAGSGDDDAQPIGYVEGDDPERGAAALLLLLRQRAVA